MHTKLHILAAAITITAGFVSATSAVAQTATPSAHLSHDGAYLADISTPEQAVVFASVQNLAARWNNIIAAATTGEELRTIMMESGAFVEDISMTFNFGDGSQVAFERLDSDGAMGFYDPFFEGLKKSRHNATSNIEVTRFTENGAEARFRWFVFLEERYSLGGIVQATVEQVDGRYRFTDLILNVQRFDMEHAY